MDALFIGMCLIMLFVLLKICDIYAAKDNQK